MGINTCSFICHGA